MYDFDTLSYLLWQNPSNAWSLQTLQRILVLQWRCFLRFSRTGDGVSLSMMTIYNYVLKCCFICMNFFNRFFIWILAYQNATINHGRLVIILIPLYLFFAAFAKFVFSKVKFKKFGDIVWVHYLCIFSFLIDLHVLIFVNLALPSCKSTAITDQIWDSRGT